MSKTEDFGYVANPYARPKFGILIAQHNNNDDEAKTKQAENEA